MFPIFTYLNSLKFINIFLFFNYFYFLLQIIYKRKISRLKEILELSSHNLKIPSEFLRFTRFARKWSDFNRWEFFLFYYKEGCIFSYINLSISNL